MSTGIGIAGELIEKASGQGPFSALDAGVNALGAAVGAYATSEWVLIPVLSPEAGYVGLMGSYYLN